MSRLPGAASSLLVAAVCAAATHWPTEELAYPHFLGGVSAAVLALGGGVVGSRGVGRLTAPLVAAAGATGLVGFASLFPERADAGLIWAISTVALIGRLAGAPLATSLGGPRSQTPVVPVGVAGALGLVGLAVTDPPLVASWVGTSLILVIVLAEVFAAWRKGRVSNRLMAGVAASLLAPPLAWLIGAGTAIPELSIATPLLAAASGQRALRDEAGPLDLLMLSPARFLVASFAVICLGGGLALSLPVMTPSGEGLAAVDALFTATSAACVTGLGVVDTPTGFSLLGQLTILGLIQVGGLGIMTFASAAAVFAGQRLSVRQEAVTADLLGADARRDLAGALRNVLLVTFVTEAIGAVLLSISFAVRGDPLPTAIWRGVFTSVSAFCNAGFALQSDSLIGYARAPDVLVTIAALIIIGGLGPAIIMLLPRWYQGKVHSVHAALVVVTTAALLVVPGVLFLAWEWSASLADLPFHHKLTNAAFQSVTLRTAGFNSVDLARTSGPTWTLMLVCMFIGGSPGSTAGGIKTTTAAVLVLAAGAALRGRESAMAFGRRIAHRTVYESMAIVGAGLASLALGVVALQMTQDMPLELLIFEVVSALGTVGLTIGGTPALDEVGKVVIILCMFAGRVGPVTLFALLAARESQRAAQYPVAPVPVG